METMTAAEFNRCYPTGSMFKHQQKSALSDAVLVKTIDIARQLKKSGAVVEINKAPYFVKISALTLV